LSQGGILNYVASTPSIPTSFSTEGGTAIPVANLLQILGGEGIDTSAAGNIITITGELATAAANVGLANIGVCAFDSADFTVVGGFVQIAHSFGGFLGILTDSGLPAVLPDIAGLVTFIGGNNITTTGGINTVTFDLTGTTDHAVQVGNATGSLTSLAVGVTGSIFLGNTGANPSFSAAMANGNLLIGNTGNNPSIASLTPGPGIAIASGAGTITVSCWGGGLSWAVYTVDQDLVVNNGYIANKAGLLTLRLPATAAIRDMIRVTGINTAVGWRISQRANQQIHTGVVSTTIGVGGYLESINIRDSVELLCVVAGASTQWQVISDKGGYNVI
jgi:hypothetical protein